MIAEGTCIFALRRDHSLEMFLKDRLPKEALVRGSWRFEGETLTYRFRSGIPGSGSQEAIWQIVSVSDDTLKVRPFGGATETYKRAR